ncbi:MAG: crotonase/enoyl-CoA hydratase family protein [Myxococcales bacterium]|nr:crotonase/enoyl-CoA hydratase family protein [Myxococcales bacterium]MDH3484862.1 crotonase/enoyl-CoA hydratase family protein [Myxococcales bacterium]
MAEILRYERSGPVATIAMDDGKVNCLSLPMLGELNRALDQAQEDDAVVVITGREGMFCGGFDLATFKQGGEPVYQMLKGGAELITRVLSFPRPVVTACSGHAVAMGAFLTMSGDVRIGAQGAFKVVCNEVAIGLTMPRFAIELSRSRLTPSHFNRAMINAETYSPEAAVDAGFLDRVVPASDLRTAAADAAEALTKLDPRAHAETKLLARARALESLRTAIATELGSMDVFVDTIGSALKVGR